MKWLLEGDVYIRDEMDNKSAVSSLQEFCAKTKNCPPTYEFIEDEDGGYVCKVTLMEIDAYGNGRIRFELQFLRTYIYLSL